ncbi:MAG: YkgJ family cysteine cluster protein [Acidobacteria bacterium]|nr:MAG: YkgJ family cysteine cluster protein [Acidobacteriota bacterium]
MSSTAQDPSCKKKKLLENLREEVAEGLRYAHSRANANTAKILEVASFAYAAIELLIEKGLVQTEELDERKNVLAERLLKKFTDQGMGVAYQDPEHEKYEFAATVQIDCRSCLPFCKAACCRLAFALSRQDVEEGIVRWDFTHPYMIARRPNGYCQHLDQTRLSCTVHLHRPLPCRAYDCRNDKRIWEDFEKKIVSPDLEDLFQRTAEMKITGPKSQ